MPEQRKHKISRCVQAAVKRTIDISASAILIFLLAPVIFLVALLILLTMGRPVLFCQHRPGLHAKIFAVRKFRTMTDARDESGDLLPDHHRITPLGKFLRATSLDELPELFSVLKGDMSMVGPRPLLPEYLERYTQEQSRRHLVKPGLTGLAQISGRRSIPFSKRLELDTYYVDHQSIWFDLKILLVTIPSVLGLCGVPASETLDDVDDLGLNQLSSFGRKRSTDATEQEGKTV
jgi:lipopolysaccharide/colanic/teichoic acid biosynthesis glycosyltransferase